MVRLYGIIRDSKLCHSIPERCFTFKNHKLPLCSRCLGIFVGGFILTILSFFLEFTFDSYLILFFLLIFPCILDSLTQELGLRTSNNKLRFIVGFLLGNGFALLISNNI